MFQNQDQEILAWEAGVYDPIREEVKRKARFLDSEEEDWLFLAKEIGWLQIDASLDAIYFTAPPPDFDERQADWYIRPDLSTFLDEPKRLCETIQKYPIPQALLAETLLQRTQDLGWSAQETEVFIQETVGSPFAELEMAHYSFLLLTLQEFVE